MLDVSEVEGFAVREGKVILGLQSPGVPRIQLRFDRQLATEATRTMLGALSTLPADPLPGTAEVHFQEAQLSVQIDHQMHPRLLLTMGPIRMLLNLHESQLRFLAEDIQRALSALASKQ